MQTFPCGHRVVCRTCFVRTIQMAVSQRCVPLRCVVCRARILKLKQLDTGGVDTPTSSVVVTSAPCVAARPAKSTRFSTKLFAARRHDYRRADVTATAAVARLLPDEKCSRHIVPLSAESRTTPVNRSEPRQCAVTSRDGVNMAVPVASRTDRCSKYIPALRSDRPIVNTSFVVRCHY